MNKFNKIGFVCTLISLGLIMFVFVLYFLNIKGTFVCLTIILTIVIFPILLVIGMILLTIGFWLDVVKWATKKKPIEATVIKDDEPDNRNREIESDNGKQKVDIECPGCSHIFKIRTRQKEIKCPECGLEGEL